MRLFDVAGLIGVALMLGSYAAAQVRLLDPIKPTSLLMNLIGASLVMTSLWQKFNLAAFVMEATWAAVALFGLLRIVLTRRRGR